MNKLVIAAALIGLAVPASAEPVDMTGLSCSQQTSFGQVLTWEFHGDAAIRYFEDGSVSSLRRVGVGSYERYDREGDWAAIYLFYSVDDELHIRALSRPGLAVREQNRAASLERNVLPFTGICGPIWEQP